MTLRVIDLVTRRPLPPGEIGELAVGGHVTPGYYKAPELDAEAFDKDGYFLTGDLGSIDADWRIRFRGRLKEMIKTGGVNVAPLEVEQVLLQHPDIVQKTKGPWLLHPRMTDPRPYAILLVRSTFETSSLVNNASRKTVPRGNATCRHPPRRNGYRFRCADSRSKAARSR
jgi:acyl-CoA synthetase (AMP-forming)/AMP-acid ligase II